MGKFFPASLNVAARPCDLCKSAAALLFCRPDCAFMCISCDARAHPTNKHDRVWVCEVCEQAPAAVTCKADAASLCAACDRDIHSANPLASRHDRVPVVPFHHAPVMKSALAPPLGHGDGDGDSNTHIFSGDKLETIESGYIAADPWISMSPINIGPKQYPADNVESKPIELLFQESDGFLDFDHNNYQISSQPFSDSVVPVQPTVKPPAHDYSSENRFIIDFAGSNINSYATSLSHSVSSSSMDVGVVPDGAEISYPFGRSVNPAVGMDREARVLRYKEKRKNRKFEKTIRYASRKAYAETRPRIKGRFAKRTDAESDIDRIFFTGGGYGVVPSF